MSFRRLLLRTPDPEKAARFYRDLFGWRAREEGLELDGGFVSTVERGSPLWLPLLEDAGYTEAHAQVLGARRLRAGLLQDPAGALFGLGAAGEATVRHRPGALCWLELMTRHPERARRFYGHLLDWETGSFDRGSMPFGVFRHRGRAVAGLLDLTSEAPGTPANWMPYFGVDDLDRGVEACPGVLHPPHDLPGLGRFAVCLDPTGAAFGLGQPLEAWSDVAARGSILR